MAQIIQPLFPFFTDSSGNALDSGFVYFGEPNQNPITNQVTMYWDDDLSIPAAQPLRTMGGLIYRNGTPANLYTDQDVSILVQDSRGRLVWSLAEQTTPSFGEFGLQLLDTETLDEAQELLELVPGVDVQVFMQEATESEMRAGVQDDLRSMSPELVADAIDELGTSVRVSSGDTTPGVLFAKMSGVNGITLSVLNNDADETLEISGLQVSHVNAAGETNLSVITGLPAGVNGFDLTLYNFGAVTNTDNCLIQLGHASAYETTGYETTSTGLYQSNGEFVRSQNTAGLQICSSIDPGDKDVSGVISFRRLYNNYWSMSGISGDMSGECNWIHSGRIQLSDTLTRIRIVTSGLSFANGVVGFQYW